MKQTELFFHTRRNGKVNETDSGRVRDSRFRPGGDASGVAVIFSIVQSMTERISRGPRRWRGGAGITAHTDGTVRPLSTMLRNEGLCVLQRLPASNRVS